MIFDYFLLEEIIDRLKNELAQGGERMKKKKVSFISENLVH